MYHPTASSLPFNSLSLSIESMINRHSPLTSSPTVLSIHQSIHHTQTLNPNSNSNLTVTLTTSPKTPLTPPSHSLPNQLTSQTTHLLQTTTLPNPFQTPSKNKKRCPPQTKAANPPPPKNPQANNNPPPLPPAKASTKRRTTRRRVRELLRCVSLSPFSLFLLVHFPFPCYNSISPVPFTSPVPFYSLTLPYLTLPCLALSSIPFELLLNPGSSVGFLGGISGAWDTYLHTCPLTLHS